MPLTLYLWLPPLCSQLQVSRYLWKYFDCPLQAMENRSALKNTQLQSITSQWLVFTEDEPLH